LHLSESGELSADERLGGSAAESGWSTGTDWPLLRYVVSWGEAPAISCSKIDPQGAGRKGNSR
jgi:hypothetical protein